VPDQTDTTKRPETNEEWNAQFLREQIRNVAAKLRSLADEVERATYAVDHVGKPGRASYGLAAVEVHHALAWGFANLNADNMIRYATDADIARAKGE
jgi:hypothetical protein